MYLFAMLTCFYITIETIVNIYQQKATVIAEQMAAESRYSSVHEGSVCSSLAPSCNVSVCDEDLICHEPDYNQPSQLQFANHQADEVRYFLLIILIYCMRHNLVLQLKYLLKSILSFGRHLIAFCFRKP